MDAMLAAVLGFVHLYRYPSFFFPRTKTFVDVLPQWLLAVLGHPVKDLVPNPIALALVSAGALLVLGYLLTDLLLDGPWRDRMKVVLITAMVVHFVVLPVCYEILRYIKTQDQIFAHDGGVIQTQLALRMLDVGKNPYTENYKGTQMDDNADPNDPPLFHFPYLPFVLEFSAVVRWVCLKLTGEFDMRVVYLGLFLGMLPLIWRLAAGLEARLLLVMLFAFNPLLTQFMIQGRNDVFSLAWLVAAVFLLRFVRAPGWGMAALAASCASKPFSWLFVPFALVYLWRDLTWDRGDVPVGFGRQKWNLIVRSAPFWAVLVVLIGPFAIWDFYSMYDDVYLFNAGKSVVNYAFGGTPGVGFPNFVILLGGVDSLQDSYPLWPFQLVFAGGLLGLMLWRQVKQNTLRTAVTGYAVSLFVFLFFARLFHDNYLGYIGSFFIISALGSRLDERVTK